MFCATRFFVPALLLLVSACANPGSRATVSVAPAAPAKTWAATASAQDQVRLMQLGDSWNRARAAVSPRLRAKMAAEGALVDPSAALEAPALPPGPYHCRLIRFGGSGGYASFPPDFCYVEVRKDGLSFTKQTGSNLPEGWVYDDTPTREVFLGTFRRRGQPEGGYYGRDPAHDVAGVVERVAPFRWRLVLTHAGRGSLLDLYELVPVTPAVPGAPVAVPGD